MQTVAFYTLGCKLNFSETSTIGRQFTDAGFKKIPFEEPAGVYVINTCSVTESANRKCRNIVNKALRSNPAAYVVVVGCYAQLKPREIAAIPGVDMVLGAGDKFRILELAEDFQKGTNACVFNSQIGEVNTFVPAFAQGERTRAFLKLQDGCDYKCSFCTIPLARGRSRSDSIVNVIANAHELQEAGIKEVVLTGVNLGDYGKDQPENFFDVVNELDKRTQIRRYRISSIEPNLLSNRIIEHVAISERFMPHFHLPLQSGSNAILGKMRRRYRRELFAERVASIKSQMPHACIGVDVIVGFPGESDIHFEDTYRFLQQLDISYLHVFSYSERENTHAITLGGVVPKPVRHERSKALRSLSAKKRRFFYEKFVGHFRPVLWETPHPTESHLMVGHTDNYVKVVAPLHSAKLNQVTAARLDEVLPNGNMKGTHA
ncbi:MAG: tRNA (N(6)-L-threonylcarbamoyladenosine(37)-C(2))-methylthiotransferase MtaB [Bacteroidota bacterium]